MADERKKVSMEQLQILLEEVEKDSSLMNARTRGRSAKAQYGEKWEWLAMKLNGVENGVTKNIPKWQQALRDWKSNTKKKAKALRDENTPVSSTLGLTSLEQRLLTLISNDVDTKTDGIDISTITEVDPLSDASEDGLDSSMDSKASLTDSKTSFMDTKSFPAESVTVYTRSNKLKRSGDGNKVNVKRMRISRSSQENNNNVTTKLISRIIENDNRQAKLMESLLECLERTEQLLGRQLEHLSRQEAIATRSVEAQEFQANALIRIADYLESRATPN